MIHIFKWIIQFQSDSNKIFRPYLSYLITYLENICNTSADPSVISAAQSFMENEIKEKTNEDGTTTIDCTFNPIYLEDKSKANITYFFKVVENSTHYYGEEYNTIAVMESPYHTVYKRNPEENNGKITLSATGDLSNWCYLQVIAQIQQDTFLEYVAYDGIKNIRDAPKVSESSSGGINTTVFVVVAVILLSLIAGLVVVVFIFQQRNKSLMNQVKHVSFQQNAGAVNTSSTDPELLLQKNQSPQ